MFAARSTRPHEAAPAGHVAAAHAPRPAAAVPPRGYAEPARDLGPFGPLDEVLRGLSWRSPASPELAREAVERLKRTRAQLGVAAGDPVISDQELLRGVEQLGVRCQWVLGHWIGELDRLADEGWSGEHAQSLASDLQLLAQAGAPIRERVSELVASPARVPEKIAASYAPFAGSGSDARHRRLEPANRRATEVGSTQGPGSPVGVVVRVLYRHRIIGFSLVAGSAALAVGALFHVTVPHEVTVPRARGAATASPGRAAQTERNPSLAPTPRGASTQGAAVASGSAAGVTDLQVLLLGGSAAQRQVVAEIVLETSDTRPMTLAVSYWGQAGTVRHGQSWYSTTVSGAVNYEVPLGIPSGPYCGQAVEVAASAGGRSDTKTTSPGC